MFYNADRPETANFIQQTVEDNEIEQINPRGRYVRDRRQSQGFEHAVESNENELSEVSETNSEEGSDEQEEE